MEVAGQSLGSVVGGANPFGHLAKVVADKMSWSVVLLMEAFHQNVGPAKKNILWVHVRIGGVVQLDLIGKVVPIQIQPLS